MTARDYTSGVSFDEVAVFPLPQVVLFPGAILPLHVFEPRYRTMTRDVLSGSRHLVVASIPEHHEVDAYGRPTIVKIAGLGEIMHEELLPDGRYHLMVLGRARVTLDELPFVPPYRRASARVLSPPATPVPAADLTALLSSATRLIGKIRERRPSFCVPDLDPKEPGALADLCAHHLVMCGEERQHLLETLCPRRRVEQCLSALATQESLFRPKGPCN